MISITSDQLPLILAIIALVALLAVIAAARRAAAQHQLRTVCLRCTVPFQARARMNFVGFREMTCPSCGAAELYPLPRVIVVTYCTMLVGICVGVAVQFLTDPEYRPPLGGIWVLALPFALVMNRRIWRDLRVLSASADASLVPMERVDRSPGA